MLVLKELSQSSNQVLLHLQEDDKKAVCPVYYKPDYFGMIIGIAGGKPSTLVFFGRAHYRLLEACPGTVPQSDHG